MNIPNKFKRIKVENNIYFYNIYSGEDFLIEDYYIHSSNGGGSLYIFKIDKKIKFGDVLDLSNWNR